MKIYKLHNFRSKPYGLIEWLVIVLYIILASALCYRLIFYPTAQLIPFLALALAAIFIIWRPVLGTALYFLSYPLVPASGDINMMKLVMLLLTVFLFALWLWRKLKAREHVWNLPEYKWLFLFFIYLGFSPFLGPAYGFSILAWARAIAPMLNLLLIPMLVEHFSEKRNKWLFYLIAVPIAVALSRDLINLVSKYISMPFNPLNYFAYGLSTYHIGLVFCLGIIFFIYRLKPKYFWLAMAIVSLAVTLFTITRTVWISVAFSAAQLLFFYTKFRRLSMVLISLCILAIGWLYFLPQEQAVSLKTSEQRSSWLGMQSERFYGIRNKDVAVMNRNIEFRQAWRVFLSSPFVGVGFGYIYRFWRYHVSGLGGSGFWYTNFVHNDIVNILAKGGAIGFLLWLAMIRGFLKRFYEKRRNETGIAIILSTIGIIAIFNAIFVGSSTPVFQTREAMFFLSIVMALGLCQWESRDAGTGG